MYSIKFIVRTLNSRGNQFANIRKNLTNISRSTVTSCLMTHEPPHGKTNNLHRQKQRRRSASQYCEADQCLCFRYTDSTISLLFKTEISSF